MVARVLREDLVGVQIPAARHKFMAKILYGVCGEGSGHSSRAKEIIGHLLEKGHQIKIISYDRGLNNLSHHFEVEEIDGLGFHYDKNEIRLIPTIISNAMKVPKFQSSIEKVLRMADDFKPQIVFSDFEPISCIVANIKKLPLISIDNQHRLTNTKIEYPEKYMLEAEVAKAVTRAMIFNSKACLVISFDRPPVLNNKTFLLNKSFIFKSFFSCMFIRASSWQNNYKSNMTRAFH